MNKNKLQEEIDSLHQRINESFNEGLKTLLINVKKNLNLGSLKLIIPINNHGFNDGDQTYFSLYYEASDISLIYKDDLGENNEIKDKKVLSEIASFFSSFDFKNYSFFEDIFSGAYESVEIEIDVNNKVNIDLPQ